MPPIAWLLSSYKDWSFRVGKDSIGLWFLQVRARDFDAKTDEPMAWSRRKWCVSMHMTRSEIVQTALKAVLAAEEHGARERFLWGGRAIFGPHLSVDRLWELCGTPDATQTRPDV
jgi:hypothetical protein